MSVTKTLHTGETVTWTGANICYCSKCHEVFNSVAAFDHHLRRPKGAQDGATPAKHVTSDMPRNSRGYLVTALRDAEALDVITEGASP